MAQEVQMMQTNLFTTINISLIILTLIFIVFLIVLFNKNIQRRNKYIFGGIIFILILLTIIFPLNYIPFSETNGRVIDSVGNPIDNARVYIIYSCSEPKGFVDSGSKSLKYESITTDSKGEFKFNKFSKLTFGSLSNCNKPISAFKEGYGNGNNLELGIRELGYGGSSIEEINEMSQKGGVEPNMFNYLLRSCDGKYYDEGYFDKMETISSKTKQVTIELTRIDEWFEC